MLLGKFIKCLYGVKPGQIVNYTLDLGLIKKEKHDECPASAPSKHTHTCFFHFSNLLLIPLISHV